MPSSNNKSIATTPFINVTYPETQGLSSKQRTVVHSYAARTAHARVRIARVKAYQLSKAIKLQQEQPGHPQEVEPSIKKTPLRSDVELDLEMLAVLMSNSGPGGQGSGRGDPFVSFARPLMSMEHFLLDQYVTTVSPYLLEHCARFRYPGSPFMDSMIEEWIRLSLSDVGFLSGILLIASRYLSIFHQPYHPLQNQLYTEQATRYKLVCLQTLNEAISFNTGQGPFSDSVVAETMVLALDEISLGDLETSRRHMQGSLKMVELNGGPQTLGLNGFLEMVLNKFTNQVGLSNRFLAPANASLASNS
ncbi:transcriptional regulator family: Fungal Specific TF [Trichoderma aggressivum f. europaeum]|uniref:Transcriptional regulator family: Fungal Specific TF n=1 Tax=Trichoderma aggressivum f. europaeum TaxID=173218 RepID=A0AAE1LVZ4_9HYPO|nr:transcriptional regulator family: Fungal Specific TF [Trichoderma aggressivum f. europaeum]